ncbi:MAG: hypothetical protein J6U66_06055 [Lachnospiraceae bacterium]|nr:hypothetical protein [Lachnospiraceae bacterium]
MEDALIALLETLKKPVMRQGSLGPDKAYPDTFFTFWNSDEDGESFYDNDETAVVYLFDVMVYSTDPTQAYGLLTQARNLLKTNGWIITGRGFDVPSDEITHVGRGMTVAFYQNLTIEQEE